MDKTLKKRALKLSTIAGDRIQLIENIIELYIEEMSKEMNEAEWHDIQNTFGYFLRWLNK